jgi:hypothetical protein
VSFLQLIVAELAQAKLDRASDRAQAKLDQEAMNLLDRLDVLTRDMKDIKKDVGILKRRMDVGILKVALLGSPKETLSLGGLPSPCGGSAVMIEVKQL